jgi:hypothetical protein
MKLIWLIGEVSVMDKEVEIICNYCDKPFLRKIRDINQAKKRGVKSYCSKLCHSNGRSKKKAVICNYCGIVFDKHLCFIKNSKSGEHFCCREHMGLYRRGINSPNYIKGRGCYREIALRLFTNRCSVCGYSVKEVLEVHHKNGNNNDTSPNNLDILCPTHHKEYHCGVRQYTDLSSICNDSAYRDA